MTFKERLNGRKLQISTLTALIIFIITGAIGYGSLKADVKNNKEDITTIQPAQIQIGKDIAVIKKDIETHKEVFNDFRQEQRKANNDILKAVTAPRSIP